jgi:hypothetical protein
MSSISVKTSDIFERVYALTAIAGRQAGDFAIVAATPDNDDALGVLLETAISEAEAELALRLSSSNLISIRYDGTSVGIELNDVMRFNSGLANLINTTFEVYASQYVAALWIGNTEGAKSLADVWKSMAGAQLDTLAKLVGVREMYVVDSGDYSERTEDTSTGTSGSGVAVDYSEREEDTSTETDGSGVAVDYSERTEDTSTETDGSGVAVDYSEREEDTSTETDGSGVAVDYSEREEDTSTESDGSGVAVDYSERTEDTSTETEGSGVAVDYSEREEDTSTETEGSGVAVDYSERTEDESIDKGEDSAADYSEREDDTLDETEGGDSAADYSERKEDETTDDTSNGDGFADYALRREDTEYTRDDRVTGVNVIENADREVLLDKFGNPITFI